MADVQVQFLGSGDAFGSGGRFNTCIMVTAGADRFLMDCGATSHVALRRFQVDPNSIGAVLLTHLHGDHFGGLPFFFLDAQLISRRTSPLVVAGPPGLEQRITDAMEVLFPGSSRVKPRFDLKFQELPPGEVSQVNGMEVAAFEMDHPSGNPSLALRITRSGKTITYTGDTGWCDNLVAAARGVDLLITECCQFDREVKFHLNYRTLTANRHLLGAKRMVITHMNPEMLERVAELPDEFAEDGKVFQV